MLQDISPDLDVLPDGPCDSCGLCCLTWASIGLLMVHVNAALTVENDRLEVDPICIRQGLQDKVAMTCDEV